MGRVTRKKVYDSPNDVIPKVPTPHKRKTRISSCVRSSPSVSSSLTTPRVTPKKKKYLPPVAKPHSPYPDDGFPLSQAPCVVGWDSHNDISFDGSNVRIADILKDLKNDPKETGDIEHMPSTPPLREAYRKIQLQSKNRAHRKGAKGRPFRHKGLKATINAKELLDRLQALQSSHTEVATEDDKSIESLGTITRSQKIEAKPAENVGEGTSEPNGKQLDLSLAKQMEESFDMFQTYPQQVISSVKKIPSARNSPKINGSTDDLWTDDDMFDDSFVLATQAILDDNGFVSPKCPLSKRQICHTPEGKSHKRFTFTLDAAPNSKNICAQSAIRVATTRSLVSKSATSTTSCNPMSITTTIVVPSTQIVSSNTHISIPPSTVLVSKVKRGPSVSVPSLKTTGTKSQLVVPFVASNTRSLSNVTELPCASTKSVSVHLQDNKQNQQQKETDSSVLLSQVPPTQQVGSRVRFQRHSSMPVAGSTYHDAPWGKPVVHPITNSQTCGGIGAAKTGYKNVAEIVKADPRLGQPGSRSRHPISTFRQPNSQFRQPDPRFKQTDFRQQVPRFNHQGLRPNQPEPGFVLPRSRHSVLSLNRKHQGLDVTSDTNKCCSSADVSLAWSCSQFGATSTQIGEVTKSNQGCVGPALNVESVLRPSVTKVQALTKKTVILNTASKPCTVSSAMFVKPVVSTTNETVSTIPTSKSCKTNIIQKPEPNMDMSISDDLLATLAEPDDLLDSQACLALLQSPDKHDNTSAQASTHCVPELATGSMDLDYLDCLILEPKQRKSTTKGKFKENTDEAELDDFDDVLDPEVLSMLDQVELRASQEGKNKMPVQGLDKPLAQYPSKRSSNDDVHNAVSKITNQRSNRSQPLAHASKPILMKSTEEKPLFAIPKSSSENNLDNRLVYIPKPQVMRNTTRTTAITSTISKPVPNSNSIKSPVVHNSSTNAPGLIIPASDSTLCKAGTAPTVKPVTQSAARSSVIRSQNQKTKDGLVSSDPMPLQVSNELQQPVCIQAASQMNGIPATNNQSSSPGLVKTGIDGSANNIGKPCVQNEACAADTVKVPSLVVTDESYTVHKDWTEQSNGPTCGVTNDKSCVSPFKCSPEEIDKKRMDALRRRQNRLKLNKKLS